MNQLWVMSCKAIVFVLSSEDLKEHVVCKVKINSVFEEESSLPSF